VDLKNGFLTMLKSFLSGILLFGLIAVSANTNAALLVNHHGQPFEARHAHKVSHHDTSQHRTFQHQANLSEHHQANHRVIRYQRRHQHHYRTYKQHSRIVIDCLRIKNDRHYRVC
jgi:hypothetical protein